MMAWQQAGKAMIWTNDDSFVDESLGPSELRMRNIYVHVMSFITSSQTIDIYDLIFY